MTGSSATDPAETLSIRLCGRMAVEIGGREVELRGRQARLVVAYLAWNRARPVSRDELIELLWPREAPASPDDVLTALLSKIRAALGPGTLEGRRELALTLPEGAWIDVEAAHADLDRAEAAFQSSDWAEVCRAGHDVLDVTAAPFLLAHDHPWVEHRRRELDELRLRTLERVGSAALELGGSGIGAAERSGRAIVESAPFRESGHLLLMEALAARGDVAEALRAYEDLRVRLRDELGAIPGADLRALHERLLSEGERPPAPPAPPRDERKLVTVVALACDEPERAREELARLEASVLPGDDVIGVFGIPRAHEDDAERAVEVALRMGGRAALATGDVLVRDGEPAGEVLERAPALLRVTPMRTVLADELTARLTQHVVRYEGSQAGEARTFAHRPARAADLVRRPRARALAAGGRAPDRAGGVPAAAGRGGRRGRRRQVAARRRVPARRPRVGPRGRRAHRPLPRLRRRPHLLAAARAAVGGRRHPAPGQRRRSRREAAPPGRARLRRARADRVGAGGHRRHLPARQPARRHGARVGRRRGRPRLAAPRHRPRRPRRRRDGGRGPPLGRVGAARHARAARRALGGAAAGRRHRAARAAGGAPRLGRAARGVAAHARAADRRRVAPPGRRAAARCVTGAARRVVEKAEGNPFFAEEIAHHLRDRGVRDEPLPTTVRAVLAARVDALPAAEKRALQDAAVVGRSFWASSLEATGADPAALRALEERGLVTTRPTSSLPGQTELWIRHALIREVAYQSIPDEQRRAVHAGVGEWIAALTGDRREEFVDLLAHHYERAVGPEEMRAKAVAALAEAGHGARRRAATDDAVQFADRALALARQASECLAALELKARALHAAVRADESLAAYQAALDLARGADAERLRAHATLLCARYPGAFTRPEWREWAIAQIEQGLAGDADQHDTFEVGALLIGRASMVRWFVLDGEELVKARRAAERAIEIAERIGSTQLLSHGLEALGWRDADHGFCDASATADRMLEVVRRMPDRVEAAESLVIAAICLARGGRFDDAFAAGREAAASARHLSPHRRMHAASAQTVCLLGAGRFDELAEATARGARARRARGQPDLRDGLARARRARGRASSRRSTRPPACAPPPTSRRSACIAATRPSATAGSRSCGRSSGSSARAPGSSTASRCAAWSTASTTCACGPARRARGRRRRAAGRQGPPRRARGVRAAARLDRRLGRGAARRVAGRRGRRHRRARRLRRALHGGAADGRRAAADPRPRRR